MPLAERHSSISIIETRTKIDRRTWHWASNSESRYSLLMVASQKKTTDSNDRSSPGLIFFSVVHQLADTDVLDITNLTRMRFFTATFISIVVGVPAGIWMALNAFHGKTLLCALLNFWHGASTCCSWFDGELTAMALWPVGGIRLDVHPQSDGYCASYCGDPDCCEPEFSAICSLNSKLYLQLLSLGASQWQAQLLLVREKRVLS